MKTRTLEGQMSLPLLQVDDGARGERVEHAVPCPIREFCGAYHCETGGCDGQRGWCGNAQNAFTPGKCMLEARRYKSKSFCMAWDRYTNCREVNHCVYADCRGDAL